MSEPTSSGSAVRLASSKGPACGIPVIDVHAHYFPVGLPDLAPITGDPRWPSLSVDGESAGRIMRGSHEFRRVRAPLWDVATRLDELDAAGVSSQIISPVPVMLTYWADPKNATVFARAVNESLARDAAESCGRLSLLGTLPLPDVEASIRELDRIVAELGFCGVEIGTTIAGLELDAAELRPFFEAAESLDAAIFVHPIDGGGGSIRRTGRPYDFGLGMLTDTAMAATALVFGGVLEHCPKLRVALAHGCGTFAWSYPRLRMAAQLGGAADSGRYDELVRSLWVDSLVFDPEHLRILIHRFGDNHVMVGTDHPFVPGQLEGISELMRSAVDDHVVTDAQAQLILGANALAFAGVHDSTGRLRG